MYLIVAVAIVAAVLGGYSRLGRNADVGQLRSPGDGSAGAAIPHVAARTVLFFGAVALCVTKAPARIVAVEPVNPTGGFLVQDWGTHLMGTDGIGEAKRTLRSVPGFSHAPVTERCTPDSSLPPAELGLQVSKPAEATASADSFRVEYTIGGRHAFTIVRFTIVLCSATDHTGHCP